MNKKGFVVSGVIYAILILFLFLIFGLLGMLGSRKLILDRLKNDVLNKINGEVRELNYSLGVTNIQISDITNGASEQQASSFTQYTTTMHVVLPSNSFITYEVDITNNESLNHFVSSIEEITNTNNNVNVDITLQTNDVLSSGTVKKFTVTLTNTSLEQQTINLSLRYNFADNEVAMTTGYTVTFDAVGGTTSISSKTVVPGEPYGQLPTPTKDGYVFKGWGGKNLFDKTATPEYSRKYLKSNGTTAASSKYNVYRTDVKPNTTYIFNQIASQSNSKISYAFYDSSDKRISSSAYGGYENIIIITPSNVSYIKYTIETSIIDNVQLEEGDTVSTYESYYVTADTLVIQESDHTLTAIWEPVSTQQPNLIERIIDFISDIF